MKNLYNFKIKLMIEHRIPLKRSIHYKSAKFVQTQKVENFQLSFTALLPTKSAWQSIIFGVITYLFAGARSNMVSGNPTLVCYSGPLHVFEQSGSISYLMRKRILSFLASKRSLLPASN